MAPIPFGEKHLSFDGFHLAELRIISLVTVSPHPLIFANAKKNTTGGRNGYGAKFATIFSVELVAENRNAVRGLSFR